MCSCFLRTIHLVPFTIDTSGNQSGAATPTSRIRKKITKSSSRRTLALQGTISYDPHLYAFIYSNTRAAHVHVLCWHAKSTSQFRCTYLADICASFGDPTRRDKFIGRGRLFILITKLSFGSFNSNLLKVPLKIRHQLPILKKCTIAWNKHTIVYARIHFLL